jgi:hypothetical protein
MIPRANGIVFAYKKGELEENIVVSYKMLSLEMNTFTDVAKNIFMLAKFGNNYRIAEAYSKNYITERALVMPSGKVLICDENGDASLISDSPEPEWSGEIKYKGEAPSDMVIYKNSLWASFEKGNVLLRFNPATMREELRIGGKNSAFISPVNIFIDGNFAVICGKENNKLIRINLDSYMVEDYKEFDEAVIGYAKINGYEFIHTKSGIYVM